MSKQLAGTPFTVGGTADTTVTNIVFTNPLSKAPSFARDLLIRNTGATIALLVYFPANTVPLTIKANTSERFDGPIQKVSVKAASATTTYEVFASLA